MSQLFFADREIVPSVLDQIVAGIPRYEAGDFEDARREFVLDSIVAQPVTQKDIDDQGLELIDGNAPHNKYVVARTAISIVAQRLQKMTAEKAKRMQDDVDELESLSLGFSHFA